MISTGHSSPISIERCWWTYLLCTIPAPPLPSSAAVGRLFSTAGDVLRAKRSSLDEVNFEELVFLKGNISLLEEKMGREAMRKEGRKLRLVLSFE